MKIIYNDIIPFKGFTAINLFGIVFARKEHEPLNGKTLRHEAIHSRQWLECSIAGAVLALAVSALSFALWLILTPILAFPVLYLGEWLFRVFQYGWKSAYENISFEREAYEHQDEPDYPFERRPYAFLRYVKKK